MMRTLQGFVLALCVFFGCFWFSSGLLVQQKKVGSVSPSAFPVYWKTTKLDHFNPLDTRTFRQRYWINDLYWNNHTGPVLLYINGEGPASGPPQAPDDEVVMLAKELNALIVTEEHRYYGETQPFPKITTDNLRFLSSRQALSDLADLVALVKEKILLGGNQKWFTIGGSYSGALSAWFRLKFPHLTTGSVASSGVVNAILDFTAFDKQVSTSVGPACANTLRNVTSALEVAIRQDKMKTLALFDAQSLTIDGDFFYFTGDAMATSVQYGLQDNLCNPLMEAAQTNADLVLAFAKVVKTFWIPIFGSPEYYSTAYQSSTEVGPDRNYRPWWFQKCTEFAWFQTAPANNSIRSKVVDLAYHRQHCKDLFGQDLWPDVDATNEYYGGAQIQASNVIFVDGSQDPWQHASVSRSLSPSEPSLLITCHNCGHCVDLLGCPGGCKPPVPFTKGREIISQYVKKWINGQQ